MIGHTKSTAGPAGMIKVAPLYWCSRRWSTRPIPTSAPTAVRSTSTEPRPWIRPDAAGARGVAPWLRRDHFTLRWRNIRRFPCPQGKSPQLARGDIRAAGRRSTVCWQKSTKLASWLKAGNEPAARPGLYPSLSYAGRQAGRFIDSALVASFVDRRQQMLAWRALSWRQTPSADLNPQGIYFAAEPLGKEGKIAFLYPGQGSGSIPTCWQTWDAVFATGRDI